MRWAGSGMGWVGVGVLFIGFVQIWFNGIFEGIEARLEAAMPTLAIVAFVTVKPRPRSGVYIVGKFLPRVLGYLLKALKICFVYGGHGWV
jgi:hypothetical protein